MNDYKEKKFAALDALILDRLNGQSAAFCQLSMPGTRIEEEARRHARVSHQSFRVVDRRLQALRKAGKVKYGRQAGWTVV